MYLYQCITSITMENWYHLLITKTQNRFSFHMYCKFKLFLVRYHHKSTFILNITIPIALVCRFSTCKSFGVLYVAVCV